MTMIYGYIRVSTSQQETENQRFAIEEFLREKNFIAPVVFVEERVSGKIEWEKRELKSIIENVRKGDIIVVSELSRLGRSMLEVMEILSIIMKKEVVLYAIKGNYQLGDNIQSKVLAFAFSLSGEIERELISARTKESLRLRRQRGQPLGHKTGTPMPKVLEGRETRIYELLAQNISKQEIAKQLNVSRMTLYRHLKRGSFHADDTLPTE